MEEVDRLLARFEAAVAAGRIRCDDVEDVRSGAGSGDLDQAVDLAVYFAGESEFEDDDFWRDAERALDAVGEDSEWVWRFRSEARPMGFAHGWGHLWTGRDGALRAVALGPYAGPLWLGRRDVEALVAALPAGEARAEGALEVSAQGHLALQLEETALSGEAASRLRAQLVDALPRVTAEASLDPDRQRPAREPATVARAREQWAAGQRIVAARTWREATGGSLEEAMAALEQV